MASIEKRDKKWRVRYTKLRGGRTSVSCPNRTVAREIKLAIEAAHANGVEWNPRRICEVPDLSVGLKAFIRECGRVHSAPTLLRYAQHLQVFERFVEEHVGPSQVDVLSRQLLADFWDWLAVGLHGRPRKTATKRKYIEVTQLAWAWLYDHDDFGDHMSRPRKLRMPKGTGSVTVAPTWLEMDSVIATTEGHLRRIAVVLRFTGLRVQQVMGLTWDDFDVDNGFLTIRGELGKTDAEKRGRVVPISKHLVKELAGWGTREGFLIPTFRDDGPRERLARSRDMKRAWARAGVREEACRQPHHAFRKGFVSGLRKLGGDVDSIEYLVGHSLGLRGVYTDPSAMPLRETVDFIPAIKLSDEITHLRAAANG